jgi:hypothetical protein
MNQAAAIPKIPNPPSIATTNANTNLFTIPLKVEQAPAFLRGASTPDSLSLSLSGSLTHSPSSSSRTSLLQPRSPSLGVDDMPPFSNSLLNTGSMTFNNTIPNLPILSMPPSVLLSPLAHEGRQERAHQTTHNHTQQGLQFGMGLAGGVQSFSNTTQSIFSSGLGSLTGGLRNNPFLPAPNFGTFNSRKASYNIPLRLRKMFLLGAQPSPTHDLSAGAGSGSGRPTSLQHHFTSLANSAFLGGGINTMGINSFLTPGTHLPLPLPFFSPLPPPAFAHFFITSQRHMAVSPAFWVSRWTRRRKQRPVAVFPVRLKKPLLESSFSHALICTVTYHFVLTNVCCFCFLVAATGTDKNHICNHPGCAQCMLRALCPF